MFLPLKKELSGSCRVVFCFSSSKFVEGFLSNIAPVHGILDFINLTLLIMNRRLLLMSRNATVWVFLSALVLFVTLHRDGYSQSRGNTISGVVVDDTKKPLVGATVVIEGKKAHAITDAKGRCRGIRTW